MKSIKELKVLISLFVVFVMIASLVGCGGSAVEKKADTAKGKTQIRYAFWGIPDEKAVQEKVKAAFEKENPNIEVVLDHISDSGAFPAAVLTQIAGGNAPDVFYLGEALVSSFVKKDVLMDLMPYAKKDNVDFSDFWEGDLEPMGYKEGHMWAWPKDTTPFMMYYNKDLFDAAKVAYPTADWTFKDFNDKAKALTKKEGDKVVQYGYAADMWWGPWITSVYKNGGTMLSDDKKTLKLDTPEAIAAINWYKDLVVGDNAVSPSAETLKGLGQSTSDLFNAQKAAMLSGGRWISYFIKPLKAKWGVVPFPKNTVNAPSPLLFVTLNMPKNCKNADAAWKFIKFYIGPEAQKLNSATGLGMPVLKSVTKEGSWLLEGEPKEHIDMYMSQLSNAKTLPFHPLWSKTIDEKAQVELDNVFNGKGKVEDAVKKIDAEIVKIFAEDK